MKNILLTTTALVAFAGAAAAESEIKFSLEAELGYNNEALDSSAAGQAAQIAEVNADTTTTAAEKTAKIADIRTKRRSDDYGFYWQSDLGITASHGLDNGLKAHAYFEITVANEARGTQANETANGTSQELSASDFRLSVTSSNASLYFGDVKPAADKYWTAAGDMEADRLSEDPNSPVFRGDAKFAGVDASVSYVWDDTANDVRQLSVGAKATFAGVTFAGVAQNHAPKIASEAADRTAEEVLASQPARFQDDFNGDRVIGLSAKGTVYGATVTGAVAMAEELGTKADRTSVGVEVEYPVGPVTATVYYVNEDETKADGTDADAKANYGVKAKYSANGLGVTADFQDDQGTSKWNLDGSYKVSEVLDVMAGVGNNDEKATDYYVAAKYGLDDDCTALISYGKDENGSADDEIGDFEIKNGVTVELVFKF